MCYQKSDYIYVIWYAWSIILGWNKRTSIIVANKILISEGKGILTVKDQYLNEFNKLLTEFYDTNNGQKLEKFLYENCIYGIEK